MIQRRVFDMDCTCTHVQAAQSSSSSNSATASAAHRLKAAEIVQLAALRKYKDKHLAIADDEDADALSVLEKSSSSNSSNVVMKPQGASSADPADLQSVSPAKSTKRKGGDPILEPKAKVRQQGFLTEMKSALTAVTGSGTTEAEAKVALEEISLRRQEVSNCIVGLPVTVTYAAL